MVHFSFFGGMVHGNGSGFILDIVVYAKCNLGTEIALHKRVPADNIYALVAGFGAWEFPPNVTDAELWVEWKANRTGCTASDATVSLLATVFGDIDDFDALAAKPYQKSLSCKSDLALPDGQYAPVTDGAKSNPVPLELQLSKFKKGARILFFVDLGWARTAAGKFSPNNAISAQVVDAAAGGKVVSELQIIDYSNSLMLCGIYDVTANAAPHLIVQWKANSPHVNAVIGSHFSLTVVAQDFEKAFDYFLVGESHLVASNETPPYQQFQPLPFSVSLSADLGAKMHFFLFAGGFTGIGHSFSLFMKGLDASSGQPGTKPIAQCILTESCGPNLLPGVVEVAPTRRGSIAVDGEWTTYGAPIPSVPAGTIMCGIGIVETPDSVAEGARPGRRANNK
jgi:hypothetical protein